MIRRFWKFYYIGWWFFRGRSAASKIYRLGCWLRKRGVWVSVSINPQKRAAIYLWIPPYVSQSPKNVIQISPPTPLCRSGRDGLD